MFKLAKRKKWNVKIEWNCLINFKMSCLNGNCVYIVSEKNCLIFFCVLWGRSKVTSNVQNCRMFALKNDLHGNFATWILKILFLIDIICEWSPHYILASFSLPYISLLSFCHTISHVSSSLLLLNATDPQVLLFMLCHFSIYHNNS